MPHVDTPWIGLAALGAMFAIPFIPNWLFEGPRTIRHRPRRHACADCGARWTPNHACELDDQADTRPLRAQLRRITPAKALEPSRRTTSKIGNS
jgi:hypothetical protein